jgi:DNA-binding winged helix-turn-helix (wHTH) protein/nitrogen regulatory protein PII
MKTIEAIIQRHKVAEVTEALIRVGVQAITITETRHYGRQESHAEIRGNISAGDDEVHLRKAICSSLVDAGISITESQLRDLTARLGTALLGTQIPAREVKLQAGDLEINFERRTLARKGKEIHLSPKEFELLAFMMKHMNVPLTNVTLLQSVWGPNCAEEVDYVRSYIRMLRKKIEENTSEPAYILTEPWVGYRFQNPSDPDSGRTTSANDELTEFHPRGATAVPHPPRRVRLRH